MLRLDPDASFTPRLSQHFGAENITVVKHAVSGQPIRRWYKDWQVTPGQNPNQIGDLYQALMEKVQQSTDNKTFDTITLVWMQGERDAREKLGEKYQESFIGLLAQVSSELNTQELNFVIGRLSDFDMDNARYPDWTRVREIQQQMAQASPRGEWVDTDSFNDGHNKRGKKIENDLHYSVEGYQALGLAFAEKSIALIETNQKHWLWDLFWLNALFITFYTHGAKGRPCQLSLIRQYG